MTRKLKYSCNNFNAFGNNDEEKTKINLYIERKAHS